MTSQGFGKPARAARRKASFAGFLLSVTVVSACSSYKPPEISYDTDVPPLRSVPISQNDESPKPLHLPPAWKVAHGGKPATSVKERLENANAAARVEPSREGYYNAIQIYPWSEGALYQVYAAPGQITNITLEPGERLAGAGPIAAGDTARWIIGDTESGSGESRRVHILVKPTRPDISTNLVISTDRRVYMIELSAEESLFMPSVAWAYPEKPVSEKRVISAAPTIPAKASRRYRYSISGDTPPWTPLAVFDDGRRVYIAFPRGIIQGEIPPLFVIGAEGETEIVNSRVHQRFLIVDRLFAAAELRLGSGRKQQVVRIVRTDGRRRGPFSGSFGRDDSDGVSNDEAAMPPHGAKQSGHMWLHGGQNS
ncbi:Type IV secretion system protein PtlF precursor [Labrenzia sp. THAF82]|uniref:P-type conjugative transfer protein TrbG n=1 Tax=Labrenzia sp. THAF82 TaxID=2587861 RepID=UPI001269539D|nr:P-type conjugative transfer protein TrbG [Labrenzia sp. THAF82]QFT34085.1 Type IV secretion system protein PtlF precursor [Labrenzia sp. THAF82]